MQSILYLISRFHVFLIFLILEIIALYFVVNSNNYQEVKYVNTSNAIAGFTLNITNSIKNYIFIVKNNKYLVEENARLKKQIQYQYHYQQADSTLPTQSEDYTFEYIPAKIINNSINNSINYITLNRGKKHGIKNGYGVVSSNGIVGIITNTTENYALVMSIISTKTRIGVRHKATKAIGNLTWNGNNPFKLNIENLNKTLPIKQGDTIITAGFSSIFPPDLPVAIVKKVEANPVSSFYVCDVKLTNKIYSLTDVYVVINKEKEELDTLSNSIISSNE